MKVSSLGVQDLRIGQALEARTGAPVADEAGLDTEAAWRKGLAGKGTREAGRAGTTSGAKALGGKAAIFAPGLEVTRTTAKSLFADVSQALSPLAPDATAADLRAALGGLGFAPRAAAEAGWVRFGRGKAEVSLRPFSIGGLPAAELEVRAPAKKKKSKSKQGVFFQGAVFTAKQWDALQTRYSDEISRFVKAVAADAGPLPDDFDGLKGFLERGMKPAEREKRAGRAAELERGTDLLAAKLDAMKAAGTAPKGVIVYVAGPDAAGKSSTGGIVMRALEKAGYDLGTAVFKAPSEAERKQHWLERFERGMPEAGQAIFWDRGPAGDSVYGQASDARTRTMGHEMAAMEKDLREQGILLVKVELSAAPEKQAATFGKRLARQHIAAKLEAALAVEGQLDGDAEAGIAEIKGKLDGADFTAFMDFEAIQGRFMRFVEASSAVEPWMVIDATKRHAARLDLIQGFDAALERFANP